MLNPLKLPGTVEEVARSQYGEESVRKLGFMVVLILLLSTQTYHQLSGMSYDTT